MNRISRSACARLLPYLSPCSQASSSLQAASFAKKARDEGARDTALQKLLQALEPREVEEAELSPEDQAEAERRAKEYSRQKMRAHREWQRDLSTKLKLKDAAIAALPPHLRAAAEIPDLEPFPLNRQIFMDTPPIEGFGEAAIGKQQVGRKSIGTKRR